MKYKEPPIGVIPRFSADRGYCDVSDEASVHAEICESKV